MNAINHATARTKTGIAAVKGRWNRRPLHHAESGAATAEYAIVTMAAVAFAGILVAILRSDEVRGMLLDIVRHALSLGG